MKTKKAFPLEKIELRYQHRPATEQEAKEYSGGASHFMCEKCKEKKYRFGGFREAHTNSPKVICRDCAIEEFREECGYATYEEAEIMRDRMFDVGYKINESIYERLCFMEDIDPRTEDKKLFSMATDLGNAFWNSLDKEFKDEMTEERDTRAIGFMTSDLAEDVIDDFFDFVEEEQEEEKISSSKKQNKKGKKKK